MTSPDKVIQSYLLFLEVRHPVHYRLFQRRLKDDPDAARAEAVIFSWLRQEGQKPMLHESPSVGGPDFLCAPSAQKSFLVEVTTLNVQAVERRSGWPDQLDAKVHSFSMITPNLQSKAKSKAGQLGGGSVPRVLVVSLTHLGASILLGTIAAKWLMVSEPRISVPIAFEGKSDPIGQVTDLKNAAFFKIENNKIVSMRGSLSAILLVGIFEDQITVVGLLHPDPQVTFDYYIMKKVPFLKVNWPIEGNSIKMEWVIGSPTSATYYHSHVSLTDAELRGEA